MTGDTRHADPRQPLLVAVAAAATALQENGSLSVSAIVGQIRSTATDLLSALGDREEDARWAVRIAARELDHTSAHIETAGSTPIGA